MQRLLTFRLKNNLPDLKAFLRDDSSLKIK